jgi:DNA-binding transcriptional MerR regulator
MEKAKHLYSGALATMAGVSSDTLRHYERKGLLPKPVRSSNGYRLYAPETLERVRMIRAALAVGFTIGELARILRARDRGEAPCRTVRELAGSKLELLEQRQRELQVLCRELRAVLKDWDSRLSSTKPGQRAGLLTSLATRALPKHSPFSLRVRNSTSGEQQ